MLKNCGKGVNIKNTGEISIRYMRETVTKFVFAPLPLRANGRSP